MCSFRSVENGGGPRKVLGSLVGLFGACGFEYVRIGDSSLSGLCPGLPSSLALVVPGLELQSLLCKLLHMFQGW